MHLKLWALTHAAILFYQKLLGALLVVPCLVVISAGLSYYGVVVSLDRCLALLHLIFMTVVLRQNLNTYNITFALYKAYTFAFIISSIPAYYGYHVEGGALEIGRASTTAVVVSCILILFADYLLAALIL